MNIIFDFDGVIADSFDLVAEVFGLVLADFGFRNLKTEDDVAVFRNEGFGALVKHLNIPLGDLLVLNEKCQEKISERIRDVNIFDGISKVVMDLKKKGNDLGILTTNAKENVEFVLTKFGIDDCFDYIYCEKGWFGKDKVIEELIDEKGFKKEDVIYVGDEVRDIEAMKKAGVKIIAVTWGYNTEDALLRYNPDFVARKPEEIGEIVGEVI